MKRVVGGSCQGRKGQHSKRLAAKAVFGNLSGFLSAKGRALHVMKERVSEHPNEIEADLNVGNRYIQEAEKEKVSKDVQGRPSKYRTEVFSQEARPCWHRCRKIRKRGMHCYITPIARLQRFVSCS